MRIIGLTGGIACGKSTIARWLKAEGAVVIDADAISHALTLPKGKALPAIFSAFGDEIRLPDGSLNRKALAEAVFADEAKRVRLNAILHPLIAEEIQKKLDTCRKNDVSVVLLDIPLLYEVGMETLANEVWCVSAPEDVQIQRLLTRDGLTPEQSVRRIQSQLPLAEKERRANAVIRTDQPEADTHAEVLRLYRRAPERSLS